MKMENIYWAFGIRKYIGFEDFIQAVTEECYKVSPSGHGWNPYEHVRDGPLTLEFDAAWNDPPEDKVFFEITSRTGPLTQADILYKLNNDSFDYFHKLDHRFFEGLSDETEGKLELITGS